MKSKLVKDLQVNDRVSVEDPPGIAVVHRIEKSQVFDAPSGCFVIDVKIVAGINTGRWIKDQHHLGDDLVMLPLDA